MRTGPPPLEFGPGLPDLSFGDRRVIEGFDVETGKSVRGMSSFGDVAVLSHDGMYVLSAGKDFAVIVRESGRPSPLAQFAGHTDRVTALAFLPGRRLAVSAGADNTLRIWELPEAFEPSPVSEADGADTLRVPVYGRP